MGDSVSPVPQSCGPAWSCSASFCVKMGSTYLSLSDSQGASCH